MSDDLHKRSEEELWEVVHTTTDIEIILERYAPELKLSLQQATNASFILGERLTSEKARQEFERRRGGRPPKDKPSTEELARRVAEYDALGYTREKTFTMLGGEFDLSKTTLYEILNGDV